MAAKGAGYANGLLQLIFNGTTLANLADNAAGSPATNLYFSLHTASPGSAGTQQTNEAAYTGYARRPVLRDSGHLIVSGNMVNPSADVVFGLCTAGSETETFFGLGLASSGAGTLLYYGPLSPAIAVVNGVTPTMTTATVAQET